MTPERQYPIFIFLSCLTIHWMSVVKQTELFPVCQCFPRYTFIDQDISNQISLEPKRNHKAVFISDSFTIYIAITSSVYSYLELDQKK